MDGPGWIINHLPDECGDDYLKDSYDPTNEGYAQTGDASGNNAGSAQETSLDGQGEV